MKTGIWIGAVLLLAAVPIVRVTRVDKGSSETAGQRGDPIVNTMTEVSASANPVQPLDIRSRSFFWLLRPWKTGTLVTIDGWGRFSELSFKGEKGLTLKPLVNFPRQQTDRLLYVWPEAGLIMTKTSNTTFHIADTVSGKTKSFMPLLTWTYISGTPILLDPEEGIINIDYSYLRDMRDKTWIRMLYNYKTDTFLEERRSEGTMFYLDYPLTNTTCLAHSGFHNRELQKRVVDFFVYDWRKDQVLRNAFTESLTNANIYSTTIFQSLARNIHFKARTMFTEGDFGYENQPPLKIVWNEDYSETTITPISYLLPAGLWFDDFLFSSGGSWVETQVGGFRGLHRELLYKRAFFHLDARYPNGISMPIFTEDYLDGKTDYGSFVEHPVYGTCFAEEWYKGRQLYLRLYKMSDVLAEINRQLLETGRLAGK
ncbi:MAG: hypothetical protein LBC31_07455 [Treponema sp.]|jgi:hypothetical protein|nr:hypothetical protein [Treponema sp.]